MLIDVRERESKGEREKPQCGRGTSISCPPYAPQRGIDPQPRHMPWPRIEPATLQFVGQHSSQLSHTGQGCFLADFKIFSLSLVSSNLIVMWVGVVFFIFIVLGFDEVLGSVLGVFIKLGVFLDINFLNIFYVLCLFQILQSHIYWVTFDLL